MKVTRLKHVKRILSFYRNSFGFGEPYHVLVDGTFCQAALTNKIYIKEQLPKYLDGSVALYTTKCILEEGRNLAKVQFPSILGAVLVAKRFYQRKCKHQTDVTAAECILDLIGEQNEKHYLVATQDRELRRKLRKFGCVPVLYINYNAIILEKPSFTAISKADYTNNLKLQPSKYETDLLNDMKNVYVAENELKCLKGTKRKRPAGPNPLSIKKKNKKNRFEEVQKRKHRYRKRIRARSSGNTS